MKQKSYFGFRKLIPASIPSKIEQIATCSEFWWNLWVDPFVGCDTFLFWQSVLMVWRGRLAVFSEAQQEGNHHSHLRKSKIWEFIKKAEKTYPPPIYIQRPIWKGQCEEMPMPQRSKWNQTIRMIPRYWTKQNWILNRTKTSSMIRSHVLLITSVLFSKVEKLDSLHWIWRADSECLTAKLSLKAL